jgi:hypothetical protein
MLALREFYLNSLVLIVTSDEGDDGTARFPKMMIL